VSTAITLPNDGTRYEIQGFVSKTSGITSEAYGAGFFLYV
jgi:hypothetical protein